MTRFLFIVVFLVCATAAAVHAQTFQATVVGSNGGHFTGNNAQLTWTLGEIVTETYTSSNGILTTGFHQPMLVKVTGLDIEGPLIAFYPNPVRDLLHVKVPYPGEYRFELVDLFGRKQVDENFTAAEAASTHQVELTQLVNALYLVRVTHLSTKEEFTFKIEKD